jgi:carbonic anhydrase
MTTKARNKVSHTEALARLQAGNNRFVQNVRSVEAMGSRSQRDALVRGQDPFAIVLSCSDSRVPSELVFDCGFGDLFVVRVAGNVVAASIVGSIEFAASAFGTELVVVMGHTNCGAVAATLDALAKGKGANILSANVGDIVDRIAPAVFEIARAGNEPNAMKVATRANVRASANHLRHGSRVIEERIASGTLAVVGAEYALETGHVDFFDIPKSYVAA